jgi:hypothetical protein
MADVELALGVIEFWVKPKSRSASALLVVSQVGMSPVGVWPGSGAEMKSGLE